MGLADGLKSMTDDEILNSLEVGQTIVLISKEIVEMARATGKDFSAGFNTDFDYGMWEICETSHTVTEEMIYGLKERGYSRSGFKFESGRDWGISADMIDRIVDIYNKTVEEIDPTIATVTFDETIKEEVIAEMIAKVRGEYSPLIALLRLGCFSIPKKEEMDAILHKWAEAKWKIYLAFGRNIILTDKKEEDMDIMNINAFVSEMRDTYPIASIFLDQFRTSEIQANSVRSGNSYHNKETGNKISILTQKYFAKPIADLVNDTLFSGNKVTNYYSVSIHPLDYLTEAVGNGWRSDFTPNYGRYFGSVVDFLFDSTTTIGYKWNGKVKDLVLDNSKFRWNAKLRMQRYYVNPEFLSFVAGEYYPEYDGNFVPEVVPLIKEKLGTFSGVSNEWNSRKQYTAGVRSFYPGYGSYLARVGEYFYFNKKIHPQARFNIGVKSGCILCGKPERNGNSKFVCHYCSNR